MTWNLQKPDNTEASDHKVAQKGSTLKPLKIGLGICGSIAAYKSPDLIRLLRKLGASVTPFASSSALNFVTERTLEWTSGQKPVTSLTANAEHLGGDSCYDIFIFAPATYSTINKMATGIADTPVTIAFSSALGHLEEGRCTLFIAPCMHGSMHNEILIESMKKLQSKGIHFIEPRQEDGKNKLPEPEVIIEEVLQVISKA